MAAKPKKKVPKRKFHPMLYVVGVLILCIAIVGVFKSVKDNPNEITENDVLANNVPAKDISFFGVKLGDTDQRVTAKLGKPDYDASYDDDIRNIEYSKKLGMPETGILFHFESGILVSVTIKEPMNRYLIGETKIGGSQENILRKYGTTDKIELQYPYKIYTYNAHGLKFLIDKKMHEGTVFFL